MEEEFSGNFIVRIYFISVKCPVTIKLFIIKEMCNKLCFFIINIQGKVFYLKYKNQEIKQ